MDLARRRALTVLILAAAGASCATQAPDAAHPEKGVCIVEFNVTSTGEPTAVEANCDPPFFNDAARDAVSGHIYDPTAAQGRRVAQRLEFHRNDSPEDAIEVTSPVHGGAEPP